jgi:hypothetical protein
MPKIKNTKHRVQIINLPDGFELVDGELVKKAHGGNVTGDQSNYGLVTYNSSGNYKENEVEDTDVRYSLSSVPRDVANIEAEGGETVLTDLSNDGNFGLYDINGPRHSKGGVPMYLPEQSFIFSDTDKMKMSKDELAEFGIESKKKMTPAKVSKKFDLNKYYGLLNDEYADKYQAESAELMLTKNGGSLSKLAFSQELKKDFEEGVPVASHPYLNSIGLDPMEFTAQVEQRQQGQQGEQGQQQMRYGGILGYDGGGPVGHPQPHPGDNNDPNGGIPYAPKNMMQADQYLVTDPGQLTSNLVNNQSNPNTSFNSNAQNNVQNNSQNQTPQAYNDPTVERMDDDRSWSERQGSKLGKGLDRFMDSPGMKNVGEVGMFAGALADSANSFFLDLKGKRAENDLQRMTMADNAYGVVEEDQNAMGYWDTQTGLINQNMQGEGPSGFNGAYNQAKYGSELPKAQEGVETGYYDALGTWHGIDAPLSTDADYSSMYGASPTDEERDQFIIDQQAEFDKQTAELNGTPAVTPAKAEQLWKEGETYKGGSPEWNQWYMSDAAKDYRKARYNEYKILQDKSGKYATLDEQEYHDNYLQGQKLVNALQTKYKDDPILKSKSSSVSADNWDRYSDSRRWHAEIKAINEDIKARNAAGVASGDADFIPEKELIDFDKAGIQNFQQGYIGGMYYNAAAGSDQMNSVGNTDQSRLVDGKIVGLSDADEIAGDTTAGQWENYTIPISKCQCADGTTPDKDENGECPCKDEIEPCPKCDDNTVPLRGEDGNCLPCSKKELDDADPIEEAAPPVKAPWIQDVLKTRAIANRKRDLFLPWEPAEQRGRYEFALEDPTRQIAAINEQLNIGSRAAGTFGGPQALAARTSAMQGDAATNIANAVGGVNSRNVQTINQGNQIQSQLNEKYNFNNNASKRRMYDNTQKVLQLGMDEQNFDREQYADAMANQITNASNTYNLNSLQDYYNIDPLKGGDIYQKGSKAFEPAPLADDYAKIDRANKLAAYYRTKTKQEPTKEMWNSYMNLDNPNEQPNEKNWQREARNNTNGYGRKKGGAIKKWASPFYTGKMGV